MAKYFSKVAGSTIGAKSGRRVRYPAGIFDGETGDFKHVADVESYNPNKNPDHYQAGVKAGLIDEKADKTEEDDESEAMAPARPACYETRPMKAGRPGA